MRRFPFSAIKGQDQMVLALILNAIDPQIGGVLIRGPQGTGKSTAVRSFQDILPEITIRKGCSYNCDPHSHEFFCASCKSKQIAEIEIKSQKIITIPLGASIDRIIGTIDLEKLIQTGKRVFIPGLLANAHRNFLYVDEINLLSDHIVDLLLDVSSSGINIIEREGITLKHPARFCLIGTMNPEEGELRPQITDRLGLDIIVNPPKDPSIRSEISQNVLAFQDNPENFLQKYSMSQKKIQNQIIVAKENLSSIRHRTSLIYDLSKFVSRIGMLSQRYDLILLRCARAIAAFRQESYITLSHLHKAIALVFSGKLSRSQKDITISDLISTFDEIWHPVHPALNSSKKTDVSAQKSSISRTYKSTSNLPEYSSRNKLSDEHLEIPEIDSSRETSKDQYSNYNLEDQKVAGYKAGKKQFDDTLTDLDMMDLQLYFPRSPLKVNIHELLTQIKKKRKIMNFSSKGSRVRIHTTEDGDFIYSRIPHDSPHSIAFLDSITRHYLHYPKSLRRMEHIVFPSRLKINPDLAVNLTYSDLKEKVFERKAPYSFYFIVDASASMRRTLEQTIKVIQSVHAEGYKKKDKVCVISFQGRKSQILQRPSVSFSVGLEKLRKIEATSYTPLASALVKCIRLIHQEQIKGISIPVIVIISDLGANISLDNPDKNATTNESFMDIADELVGIARKIGRLHYNIIIMKPKKSFATRFLGVDPFSVQKIEGAFLTHAQAEIFEYDAYDPQTTILQLNQILD